MCVCAGRRKSLKLRRDVRAGVPSQVRPPVFSWIATHSGEKLHVHGRCASTHVHAGRGFPTWWDRCASPLEGSWNLVLVNTPLETDRIRMRPSGRCQHQYVVHDTFWPPARCRRSSPDPSSPHHPSNAKHSSARILPTGSERRRAFRSAVPLRPRRIFGFTSASTSSGPSLSGNIWGRSDGSAHAAPNVNTQSKRSAGMPSPGLRLLAHPIVSVCPSLSPRLRLWDELLLCCSSVSIARTHGSGASGLRWRLMIR